MAKRKQRIGGILIFLGIMILFVVAGTSDYQTMTNHLSEQPAPFRNIFFWAVLGSTAILSGIYLLRGKFW